MQQDKQKHCDSHEQQHDNCAHEVEQDLNSSNDTSEEVAAAINDESSTTDKIKQLEQDNAKLKDDIMRVNADMQNAARRSLLNLEQSKYKAIQSFATDMLLVKDYLEYAVLDVTDKLNKIQNSKDSLNQSDFTNVQIGIKATLDVLSQTFHRHDIKEIEIQPKQKLDPNSHNAVAVVEHDDYEPNTIVSIKKGGYKLKDKVIRAADVEVAK